MPGKKQIFGVVHLMPLPESPRYGGSRAAIEERALRDAEALVSGGADGFVIENFGDAPFHAERVPPSTIAEMTVLVERVRRAVGDGVRIGINVLRNDAGAALAIAAATGAAFVRVNVHTGVVYADQGTLEGRAAETLRLRRQLDARVQIWADVAVKHALVPYGFSLPDAAKDTALRGLADALIVTGSATGAPTSLADLQSVRAALPDAMLLVGSGITEATIGEALAIADGVIVGSFVKENAEIGRPVAAERVRRLVRAAGG